MATVVAQRALDRLSLNVDGNFEIYVIRPDGTDLTRVTDYAGLDQFPEWSPNGKQLAIRRDIDLYLIDLDGSNPIQLTAGALINQMASWSPNGKKLAFLSTRDGYPSVFVMETDGSNQVNLTPKPGDVPANAWRAAERPTGREMGSTSTSRVAVPKRVSPKTSS